jgi:hypothetical protein
MERDTETVPQRLPGAFELFGPSVQALLYNVYSMFYIAASPFLVLVCAGVLEYSTVQSDLHIIFMLAAGLAVLGAFWLTLVSVPALIYAQLQSVRSQKAEYGECLKVGRHYFWRMWGLLFLSTVAVCAGLALLIIPGVFVLQRVVLAPYILVDKDVSISAALRGSNRLAQKYGRALWGFLGVWALIYMFCLAVPYLGFIFGGALTLAYYCAAALRYEQIKNAETDMTRPKKHAAATKIGESHRRAKKSSRASP